MKILVRCAEIRGKYTGDLYSESKTEMRDCILAIGSEIEAMLVGDPAQAPETDYSNFDTYKPSRVAS
jgi:hypothetical protein